MKKITSIAICSAALASFATAEVAGEFYTGYHNNYYFRGIDLGAGLEMFDFGLDFSGDCGCGLTWNAGIWYANTDSTVTADELDFYGSVGKSMTLGPVTGDVAIGYVRYSYLNNPGGAKLADDGEWFASFATEAYGLSLGTTVYVGEEGGWDNGTWIDLTAGYGVDVTDALSVGVEVGLGLHYGNNVTNGQAGYVGSPGNVDLDGVATMSATLSLDYAVTESMALYAYGTYVESTESYADLAGGEDHMYWGGGVSFSF